MTIKEAVLKTLEENKKLMNYKDVYEYIKHKNYANFNTKTPMATVSAILSEFIKNEDNRVKRIQTQKSTYLYYFSKYENELNFENYQVADKKDKKYFERDLHKLFVTYLETKNIFSKTIYHETSKQSVNQKWIHPDIIGVEFLQLKSKVSSKFLKTIDKNSFFTLYSYELKKEINTDYELKEAYFQAVSNSSWANRGYLVALQINDNLLDELQRLNQSFGIGFILLNSYPYESKILFNSKYKELDFKTLDRLCEINKDFEKFIKVIEKFLNASDDYIDGSKKEILEFCDSILKSDNDIYNFCMENNIPFEKEE